MTTATLNPCMSLDVLMQLDVSVSRQIDEIDLDADMEMPASCFGIDVGSEIRSTPARPLSPTRATPGTGGPDRPAARRSTPATPVRSDPWRPRINRSRPSCCPTFTTWRLPRMARGQPEDPRPAPLPEVSPRL